jgi:predicted NBD/HSP70 family sugar kinase
MILAIDIGGTKTLVALVDKSGKLLFEEKFPTPPNYRQFIKELSNVVAKISTPFSITVVAAPGKLDRKNGIGLAFGNLPWKNVAIKKDISDVTKTKVLIENDANLAGLSEAIRVKPLPKRALYLTFSTGIGSGVISSGKIDPDFADSEAGSMLFEYQGKLLPWEKFDSGKAIVEKYGRRASDLNDPKAWDEISKWFAIGIIDLCAVMEPDIIIIGGGVGTHFHKYSKFLKHHVSVMSPKLVTVPPIIPAQKAEQAVIYGCLELAKQLG